MRDYPYELHLTVHRPLVGSKFEEVCSAYGMKVLCFDLYRDSQIVDTHVLTSSVVNVPSAEKAVELLTVQENNLKAAGYNVVRAKAETVPWNPELGDQLGYLECHIEIIIPLSRLAELTEACTKFNAHLSDNLNHLHFETLHTVVTIRSPHARDVEDFQLNTGKFEDYLKSQGFQLDSTADIEYCVYDSNEKLDARWMGLTS